MATMPGYVLVWLLFIATTYYGCRTIHIDVFAVLLDSSHEYSMSLMMWRHILGVAAQYTWDKLTNYRTMCVLRVCLFARRHGWQ